MSDLKPDGLEQRILVLVDRQDDDPGTSQLAAGFVIYGPHTAIVFTLGSGTHIATLDPATGIFTFTRLNVLVKEVRGLGLNMELLDAEEE